MIVTWLKLLDLAEHRHKKNNNIDEYGDVQANVRTVENVDVKKRW